MINDGSFDDFISRLNAENDRGARDLFHLYGRRLIGLARSRMDARVRGKLDPDDVVQSVLGSFFKRQAAGEYDLGDWDSLWSLLVRITLNKCINCHVHYLTQQRSVDAEVSTPTGSSARVPLDFISREPAPEEAAALLELMEEATRGLSERDRRIIEMWSEDYSQRAISSELATPQATVQRVIERVRKRLQRKLSADPPQ